MANVIFHKETNTYEIRCGETSMFFTEQDVKLAEQQANKPLSEKLLERIIEYGNARYIRGNSKAAFSYDNMQCHGELGKVKELLKNVKG